MKKALKIYISVDMEGMAGITSPSQERDEVPSFRRALHNQVRWIIEGIPASSRNDEIGFFFFFFFLILMEAERSFLMMNFARWMNVAA